MDDGKISRDFGKIISHKYLPEEGGQSSRRDQQPKNMTKVRVYQLATRVDVYLEYGRKQENIHPNFLDEGSLPEGGHAPAPPGATPVTLNASYRK